MYFIDALRIGLRKLSKIWPEQQIKKPPLSKSTPGTVSEVYLSTPCYVSAKTGLHQQPSTAWHQVQLLRS